MIDFGNIWGVARAEMRLTRRLVRFWVFVTIAGLFGFLVFFWLWFVHWSFSAGSASAASANPRFFMGAFGSNFVFVMLFGLVFLGYDVRARDTRERMVEVLDSLPLSNIELVLGRFLGVFIPCWCAALVISVILIVASNLMQTPIEMWSMINFPIGTPHSFATSRERRMPRFLSRCGECTITTMSCSTAKFSCH